MKNDSVTSIMVGIIIKILLTVILVLVLIFAGRRAYGFGYRVFAQETMSSPPGKKVAVTITENMSIGEIAELLEMRELIQDDKVFRVQYLLSEYRGEIVPGSYVLNTYQTADEMLAVISRQEEKESETE